MKPRLSCFGALAMASLGCGAVACAPGANADASASAATESALDPRVGAITTAFEKSMYQCVDRVWPGVQESYRTSQVLLAQPSTGNAFLWNDQSAGGAAAAPRMTTFGASTLGPEWLAGFNDGKYREKTTLGVSLDIMQIVGTDGIWSDLGATVAFHEAFHYFAQQGWSDPGGIRSTPYPEAWEPRYLRHRTRTALYDALRQDPSDLGAAAFWQQRLAADFPAERDRMLVVDQIEGTAQFAQVFMTAIAERGCEASDAELVDAAMGRIDTLVRPNNYKADWESYEIGLLAGLLFHRSARSGWEAEVVAGGTPAAVLLDGVAPKAQADDATAEAAAKAAVAVRNEASAVTIEPAIAKMNDPTYYRVPLNWDWMAGAFDVDGFYALVAQPGTPNVDINVRAEYRTPDGIAISLTGQTGYDMEETPCGFAALVATVPVAAASSAGGAYTVTEGPVTFSKLPLRVVTGKDGLPWLCPVPR